jgi:hypothetical protein
VETGQGATGWHSKLSSFCVLFRRERRKEKKKTETEAAVQHLRRPHQVTLLAQADFSIWFSFYLCFCFAAVIFKYLSLNRLALGGGGFHNVRGNQKNFKPVYFPASCLYMKIKYRHTQKSTKKQVKLILMIYVTQNIIP